MNGLGTRHPRWARSLIAGALVLAVGLALIPAGQAMAKGGCEPLTRRQMKGLTRGGEQLAEGVVPLRSGSEDNARRYSFEMPVQAAGLPPLGEWESRELVVQPRSSGTLHVLTQWRETNAFPIDQTDLDLFVSSTDGSGESSMVYNPFPEPFRAASRGEGFGSGDGGPGWEYVEMEAGRCTGNLIEILLWSSEEAHEITVKVWMS